MGTHGCQGTCTKKELGFFCPSCNVSSQFMHARKYKDTLTMVKGVYKGSEQGYFSGAFVGRHVNIDPTDDPQKYMLEDITVPGNKRKALTYPRTTHDKGTSPNSDPSGMTIDVVINKPRDGKRVRKSERERFQDDSEELDRILQYNNQMIKSIEASQKEVEEKSKSRARTAYGGELEDLLDELHTSTLGTGKSPSHAWDNIKYMGLDPNRPCSPTTDIEDVYESENKHKDNAAYLRRAKSDTSNFSPSSPRVSCYSNYSSPRASDSVTKDEIKPVNKIPYKMTENVTQVLDAGLNKPKKIVVQPPPRLQSLMVTKSFYPNTARDKSQTVANAPMRVTSEPITKDRQKTKSEPSSKTPENFYPLKFVKSNLPNKSRIKVPKPVRPRPYSLGSNFKFEVKGKVMIVGDHHTDRCVWKRIKPRHYDPHETSERKCQEWLASSTTPVQMDEHISQPFVQTDRRSTHSYEFQPLKSSSRGCLSGSSASHGRETASTLSAEEAVGMESTVQELQSATRELEETIAALSESFPDNSSMDTSKYILSPSPPPVQQKQTVKSSAYLTQAAAPKHSSIHHVKSAPVFINPIDERAVPAPITPQSGSGVSLSRTAFSGSDSASMLSASTPTSTAKNTVKIKSKDNFEISLKSDENITILGGGGQGSNAQDTDTKFAIWLGKPGSGSCLQVSSPKDSTSSARETLQELADESAREAAREFARANARDKYKKKIDLAAPYHNVVSHIKPAEESIVEDTSDVIDESEAEQVKVSDLVSRFGGGNVKATGQTSNETVLKRRNSYSNNDDFCDDKRVNPFQTFGVKRRPNREQILQQNTLPVVITPDDESDRFNYSSNTLPKEQNSSTLFNYHSHSLKHRPLSAGNLGTSFHNTSTGLISETGRVTLAQHTAHLHISSPLVPHTELKPSSGPDTDVSKSPIDDRRGRRRTRYITREAREKYDKEKLNIPGDLVDDQAKHLMQHREGALPYRGVLRRSKSIGTIAIDNRRQGGVHADNRSDAFRGHPTRSKHNGEKYEFKTEISERKLNADDRNLTTDHSSHLSRYEKAREARAQRGQLQRSTSDNQLTERTSKNKAKLDPILDSIHELDSLRPDIFVSVPNISQNAGRGDLDSDDKLQYTRERKRVRRRKKKDRIRSHSQGSRSSRSSRAEEIEESETDFDISPMSQKPKLLQLKSKYSYEQTEDEETGAETKSSSVDALVSPINENIGDFVESKNLQSCSEMTHKVLQKQNARDDVCDFIPVTATNDNHENVLKNISMNLHHTNILIDRMVPDSQVLSKEDQTYTTQSSTPLEFETAEEQVDSPTPNIQNDLNHSTAPEESVLDKIRGTDLAESLHVLGELTQKATGKTDMMAKESIDRVIQFARELNKSTDDFDSQAANLSTRGKTITENITKLPETTTDGKLDESSTIVLSETCVSTPETISKCVSTNISLLPAEPTLTTKIATMTLPDTGVTERNLESSSLSSSKVSLSGSRSSLVDSKSSLTDSKSSLCDSKSNLTHNASASKSSLDKQEIPVDAPDVLSVNSKGLNIQSLSNNSELTNVNAKRNDGAQAQATTTQIIHGATTVAQTKPLASPTSQIVTQQAKPTGRVKTQAIPSIAVTTTAKQTVTTPTKVESVVEAKSHLDTAKVAIVETQEKPATVVKGEGEINMIVENTKEIPKKDMNIVIGTLESSTYSDSSPTTETNISTVVAPEQSNKLKDISQEQFEFINQRIDSHFNDESPLPAVEFTVDLKEAIKQKSQGISHTIEPNTDRSESVSEPMAVFTEIQQKAVKNSDGNIKQGDSNFNTANDTNKTIGSGFSSSNPNLLCVELPTTDIHDKNDNNPVHQGPSTPVSSNKPVDTKPNVTKTSPKELKTFSYILSQSSEPTTESAKIVNKDTKTPSSDNAKHEETKQIMEKSVVKAITSLKSSVSMQGTTNKPEKRVEQYVDKVDANRTVVTAAVNTASSAELLKTNVKQASSGQTAQTMQPIVTVPLKPSANASPSRRQTDEEQTIYNAQETRSKDCAGPKQTSQMVEMADTTKASTSVVKHIEKVTTVASSQPSQKVKISKTPTSLPVQSIKTSNKADLEMKKTADESTPRTKPVPAQNKPTVSNSKPTSTNTTRKSAQSQSVQNSQKVNPVPVSINANNTVSTHTTAKIPKSVNVAPPNPTPPVKSGTQTDNKNYNVMTNEMCDSFYDNTSDDNLRDEKLSKSGDPLFADTSKEKPPKSNITLAYDNSLAKRSTQLDDASSSNKISSPNVNKTTNCEQPVYLQGISTDIDEEYNCANQMLNSSINVPSKSDVCIAVEKERNSALGASTAHNKPTGKGYTFTIHDKIKANVDNKEATTKSKELTTTKTNVLKQSANENIKLTNQSNKLDTPTKDTPTINEKVPLLTQTRPRTTKFTGIELKADVINMEAITKVKDNLNTVTAENSKPDPRISLTTSSVSVEDTKTGHDKQPTTATGFAKEPQEDLTQTPTSSKAPLMDQKQFERLLLEKKATLFGTKSMPKSIQTKIYDNQNLKPGQTQSLKVKCETKTDQKSSLKAKKSSTLERCEQAKLTTDSGDQKQQIDPNRTSPGIHVQAMKAILASRAVEKGAVPQSKSSKEQASLKTETATSSSTVKRNSISDKSKALPKVGGMRQAPKIQSAKPSISNTQTKIENKGKQTPKLETLERKVSVLPKKSPSPARTNSKDSVTKTVSSACPTFGIGSEKPNPGDKPKPSNTSSTVTRLPRQSPSPSRQAVQSGKPGPPTVKTQRKSPSPLRNPRSANFSVKSDTKNSDSDNTDTGSERSYRTNKAARAREQLQAQRKAVEDKSSKPNVSQASSKNVVDVKSKINQADTNKMQTSSVKVTDKTATKETTKCCAFTSPLAKTTEPKKRHTYLEKKCAILQDISKLNPKPSISRLSPKSDSSTSSSSSRTEPRPLSKSPSERSKANQNARLQFLQQKSATTPSTKKPVQETSTSVKDWDSRTVIPKKSDGKERNNLPYGKSQKLKETEVKKKKSAPPKPEAKSPGSNVQHVRLIQENTVERNYIPPSTGKPLKSIEER